MKCIKCRTNNINKANYCKKCSYEFSDVERKAARKNTFVGKLEMIENVYNACKLKVITDNIVFKICSLLFVLAIGIYFWITNGLDLKLLNSKNYDIQYNVEDKEYYLLTTEDKVLLNLYVPNRVEKIIISHYDENDNVLEEEQYEPTDEIVLETMQKEYYVLNADYLSTDENSYAFKFYVLKSVQS